MTSATVQTARFLCRDGIVGTKTDIAGVPVSAEGKGVGLYAWITKPDFEGPVGYCAVLPHELIESLISHGAVPGSIDVGIMIVARWCTVDRDVEPYRPTLRCRS